MRRGKNGPELRQALRLQAPSNLSAQGLLLSLLACEYFVPCASYCTAPRAPCGFMPSPSCKRYLIRCSLQHSVGNGRAVAAVQKLGPAANQTKGR